MRAVDAEREEHLGTANNHLSLQALKQFLVIKSLGSTCLKAGDPHLCLLQHFFHSSLEIPSAGPRERQDMAHWNCCPCCHQGQSPRTGRVKQLSQGLPFPLHHCPWHKMLPPLLNAAKCRMLVSQWISVAMHSKILQLVKSPIISSKKL